MPEHFVQLFPVNFSMVPWVFGDVLDTNYPRTMKPDGIKGLFQFLVGNVRILSDNERGSVLPESDGCIFQA